MKDDEMDPIFELRNQLLRSEGSLTESHVSTFINFYESLSNIEQGAVWRIIRDSSANQATFDRVFDDEMDLDPSKRQIEVSLILASGNSRIAADPSGQWKLKLSDTGIQLEQFPLFVKGQKVRINAGVSSLRIPLPDSTTVWPVLNVHEWRHITISYIFEDQITVSQKLPIQTIVLRWAAAAAVVGLASVIIFKDLDSTKVAEKPIFDSTGVAPENPHIVNNESEDTIKVTPREKPQPVQVPVFAVNFEPHPVLENFVNRNYRAEGEFVIVSPQNEDSVSATAEFLWKGDDADWTITLVDNNNRQVWEESGRYTKRLCPKTLSRGLYYWMIKRNGELKSVRKIFVTR